MKTITTFLVAAFMLAFTVAHSQDTYQPATDSTGLPGDHFSLQGALDLFKSSQSLEEFEQKLNTESNYVNNLDLDGDGIIDYISVSDKMEGTSHAIVLQIAINETESQDIAVIGIEKNGNETAVLQIIGDEELYGDSTIVEPFEVSTDKGGKGGGFGPDPVVLEQNIIIVNVWMWPCVKFIYAPIYKPWVSPWHYRHHPAWFKPWKPAPWYVHHNHCIHHHANYHPVYIYRVPVAHKIYKPYHKSSVIIINKYKPAHAAYKAHHAGKPHKNPNAGKHQGTPKNQGQKGNPPNNKGQGKGNPNPGGKKGGK
jgi:hypothetical protein